MRTTRFGLLLLSALVLACSSAPWWVGEWETIVRDDFVEPAESERFLLTFEDDGGVATGTVQFLDLDEEPQSEDATLPFDDVSFSGSRLEARFTLDILGSVFEGRVELTRTDDGHAEGVLILDDETFPLRATKRR